MIGQAPARNNSEVNSLFFVLFISVMTMFVMELFVTVIIDNFNEIKAERDGSAYMTDKQIEWVRTQKQLASRKPKEFIAPPPADQVLRSKVSSTPSHTTTTPAQTTNSLPSLASLARKVSSTPSRTTRGRSSPNH